MNFFAPQLYAFPIEQHLAVEKGYVPNESRERLLWDTSFIHHSIPWIAGGVIALMLAAILTLILVFTSRQTTLNQINVSLMKMSDHLKQMRQADDADTAPTNNPSA